MRIYVAGPLNASTATEYLKNVHKMLEAGRELQRHGFAPYLPCLDMLLGMFCGNFNYEDYWGLNASWIPAAKALYVIGDSPGVEREIKLAEGLGIPVFRSVEELITWSISQEEGNEGRWKAVHTVSEPKHNNQVVEPL